MSIKNKPTFIRLFRWEYWPMFMFYTPIIPYYLFLAVKARNLIFFLNINPALKNSGDGTESKFKTISLIPKIYQPKSLFIEKKSNFSKVKKRLDEAKIEYPLIAKPDVGSRGVLVKKIDSEVLLESYLNKTKIDIILQEFIDLKQECGILYHRLPGETKGKVSSLTLKKFLTCTGDGKRNLSELIKTNPRTNLYYKIFRKNHQKAMFSIPKKGEIINLTVIGNHCKGTQFMNGNHLINRKLELMIDEIANKIKGWNYGRLDIKYDSFDEFINGRGFKIIEINGIMSEPTHIYDSENAGYFDALKSFRQHWKIMNKIALINQKSFGEPLPKLIPYLKTLVWFRHYRKRIKRLSKEI